MYVVLVRAESDDVTSLRNVVMTTGDDVLAGEYDVISVDFLCLDVIIAVLRLVVLLLALMLLLLRLVTLVTGESVYVVIATPGDVISGWTGFDDVEISCDDVIACDVLPVSAAVCALVSVTVLLIVLVKAMSVLLALVAPVGCNVTASGNKLPLSDVTADVINNDDVAIATGDDDFDVMLGTSVEVTYSDVISGSRDVSTGVNMLTGDVITADDLRLLLLLTRVEVCRTGPLDVVMVTLLLGDVNNCTELVISLLDCSVVSGTDALLLVTSLKYFTVTSSLCCLLTDTLSVVAAMATSDVTMPLLSDDASDSLVLVVGRVVPLTCALLAESLVDKSTMAAPVVAMTTCDVITGVVITCTVSLGWLLLRAAVYTSAVDSLVVDNNSTCGLLATISSLVVMLILS